MIAAQPSRQEIKWKTASGGSYQKPLKSFGDLTFATQYCTGYTINLSANSPPVSCSTSEDPIGLNSGSNMFVFAGNDTINYIDPLGFDALTDNENVKGGMCCILERSGRLTGSNYTGERSFVAYADNSIIFGGGKSTSSSTTGKFPRINNGCSPAGYFHTHPPGGPDNPSGADMGIYKILGCDVYVLGGKRIVKYCGKSPQTVSLINGLIGWCLSNRNKWECDCNKNCPK